MRMTRSMRNISKMYEGMKLDEEEVFHKSKLLLAIYRDVVWRTIQEAASVKEACESYYSNELATALTFLNDFAPTETKEKFSEKVSCVFESKWMIDLVDTAMVKIYNYHTNGKMYHEILSKCYLSAYTLTESEILECLSIERTSFYAKKKEAIKLFGIALWGYSLPKYQDIFNDSSNMPEKELLYFFENG